MVVESLTPKMPCSGEKRVVRVMPDAECRQDVDGAAAMAVEAGLVGEQADAQVAAVAGCGFLEGGEVGGFEDIDAGEGRLGIRLVIAKCCCDGDGMVSR